MWDRRDACGSPCGTEGMLVVVRVGQKDACVCLCVVRVGQKGCGTEGMLV